MILAASKVLRIGLMTPLIFYEEIPSHVTQAAELQPAATELSGRLPKRNPNAWILAAAAVALGLKLCLALNTIGTNDVRSFYSFGHSIATRGLEQTYRDSVAFNHPPLVGWYLHLIYDLDQSPVLRANGIRFPFLLRLPGIIADLVVVLLFLVHQKRLALPTWALMAFALSPVSLMVSGFHGNTDPVMVMFLVLAAFACFSPRPLLCGLFLALACQIKIIPLLLMPIFLGFWMVRQRLLRFLLSFLVTSSIFWGEALFKFPLVIIKNVFSYGSIWGIWGITYWLRLTGWKQFAVVTYYDFPLAEAVVVTALKLIIILAILLIAWRRRSSDAEELLVSIACAWIVFFVFSPGVGTQYLVWLAPFILLLSPVLFGYLLITSSLFLFFFYNVITGGIPWYWGVSTARLNTVWTPWGVWPWAVLLTGMILLWKTASAVSSKAIPNT